MEVTGVGVSDRLIDINFALIDFSYELDYSALLGCQADRKLVSMGFDSKKVVSFYLHFFLSY